MNYPPMPIPFPPLEDDDEGLGPVLGFLIILCITAVGIAYYLNIKFLVNLAGKWESLDPNGLDRYEIDISVDKANNRFQVVGRFPHKNTPFLSRGVYPFIYKVNLYPIMDPVSDFVLKFIPRQTSEEDDETEREQISREKTGKEPKKYYHLTLERTVRTEDDIVYRYKRIQEPKNPVI